MQDEYVSTEDQSLLWYFYWHSNMVHKLFKGSKLSGLLRFNCCGAVSGSQTRHRAEAEHRPQFNIKEDFSK